MWLLQRCLSADMPAEDLSLQFTFRQTYQPLSDLHAEKQTALFATIVTERAEESEPPRPSSVSPPRSLVNRRTDRRGEEDGLPKNVGVN